MRVLICGDRNWPKGFSGPIISVVAGMWTAYGPGIAFIQGGATGADAIAKRYADLLEQQDPKNVTSLTFPAKWNEHDREGRTKVPCRCARDADRCKVAGPRRNQQMLDEGRPDVVFAFHDFIDNSRGTKDMVKRADAASIPAYVMSRFRQSVRSTHR